MIPKRKCLKLKVLYQECKRLYLFSLVILCSFNDGYSQLDSKDKLLTAARAYYDSLKIFSVAATNRYNSPLTIDTNISVYNCFVNKPARQELFIMSGNNGYFVGDGKEYTLNLHDKTYSTVKANKKKEYIYYSLFKKFPFVDLEDIIRQLASAKFSMNDSIYLLTDGGNYVEFRKSNNSIKKIVRKDYDKILKAEHYEELTFSECNSDDELVLKQLNTVLPWLKSTSPVTETGHKLPRAERLDVSQLKKKEVIQQIGDLKLENKIILIDVFFQSCYPCFQSYPYVENINQNKDSSLVVIGLDSNPDDSSTLITFQKKYNINYPVISGEIAQELSRQLGVNMWPTIILIASDGSILKYQEGFSRAFFRKLEKELFQ
jgi:hypothetical protein